LLISLTMEDTCLGAEPCKEPHCQIDILLDLFKATKQKPAWSPLQSQHIDNRMTRLYPPNQHRNTSDSLLPWVLPNRADGGHVPRRWVSRRPDGDSWGPESIQCASVPPFHFYILEEAMLPRCPSFRSGEELINLVGRNGKRLGGLHVGEHFFYWQLMRHPWRTYDPMDAQIVVVPAFLNMLVYSGGFCGPVEDGLNHISNALLNSPRYHINQGKDFLMLSTGFAPHNMLFSRGSPAKALFGNTTRNFIFVSRLNGKFLRLRPIQRRTRCVIAAPYSSQNDIANCTGSSKDGLQCPDVNHEKTFEEFMAKRDYNMFLMGQADNRIAYGSRRLAVTQAAEIYPPNYIVGSSAMRVLNSPECQGDPEKWNGCFKRSRQIPKHLYPTYIHRSKLSLMISGDDPSSGRYYESLTAGTPSVVISAGWYDQSAPFRCKVPYADMSFFLNEEDFRAATYKFTLKAMRRIYKDRAALLRKMWETQRRHVKDLLWHVPGSRVAQNVLEQAYRGCLTELRGNNDAS